MFGFGFRVDEQNPGCTGCSFVADHFDGVIPHLNGHDVTLVNESIAPLERLQGVRGTDGLGVPLGLIPRQRLQARLRGDVHRGAAEERSRLQLQAGRPGGAAARGMSGFVLRDGVVHHTYSAYARGVEQLMGTFGYLDVAPLGRN